MIVLTRGERTIDIRPSWWHRSLTWGSGVEQWCQKARGIVNGIEVFARSPEHADFVGMFAGWTIDVHGVTARIVLPKHMTDEDIERLRLALVAHLDGNPPFGAEQSAAA